MAVPYPWTKNQTGVVSVALTLYDAQTILAAVSDNTPVALTVGEQTLVGRITGGNIAALTVAQCKTLLDWAADITTHAALTTTHGAVDTATADRIVVRDASARAKFAAPAASGDALIKGTRLTAAEMLDGAAEKVLIGQGAGVSPAYGDPVPLSTAWKGSFNWDTSVYVTDEIDISALFSTNLALTTRRKYTVYLDLTNVAADASFVSAYIAVKTKVDGTNYRAIDRKTILDADIGTLAEPGIIISIPAVAENAQITLQMTTALGADATIYYAVVKEHLE